MKKEIKKPDGTVEVVEGTPQEIAEYEKNVVEQSEILSEKKKKLLLEQTQQRLVDFIDSIPVQRQMRQVYDFSSHSEECEITRAQRGWWSIHSPVCTCGKTFVYRTTTSDSTSPG